MHMRISYHFLAGLADLHITRQALETDSEKRIRNRMRQKGKCFFLVPQVSQSVFYLFYLFLFCRILSCQALVPFRQLF